MIREETDVSTHDLYTLPADHETWDVADTGYSRFTWEYDDGRDRLLRLYQKGKDKQWDQVTRIDWDIEVDPDDPWASRTRPCPCSAPEIWDKMTDEGARTSCGRHHGAWQFSQFLHGEQGAMICAARIVESVPDLDAKFYAATQTMDEARHAEIYARFLQEKVGLLYPINDHLKALLDDTLSDSRWDMPYLGMQVLIEGLALAAFGVMRDMTTKPLPKQILAYVMQDEARHVAFGRMALRDYYKQLTEAELRRARGVRRRGLLPDARPAPRRGGLRTPRPARRTTLHGAQRARREYYTAFRNAPLQPHRPDREGHRPVGPHASRRPTRTWASSTSRRRNLEDLMKADEDLAERLDREKRFAAEEAARAADVEAIIEAGEGE